MLNLQNPGLFYLRPRVPGAVQPKRQMTRREALALAAARNAASAGRKPGTFGSGLWRVLKDGTINAPFWIVVEAR